MGRLLYPLIFIGIAAGVYYGAFGGRLDAEAMDQAGAKVARLIELISQGRLQPTQ